MAGLGDVDRVVESIHAARADLVTATATDGMNHPKGKTCGNTKLFYYLLFLDRFLALLNCGRSDAIHAQYALDPNWCLRPDAVSDVRPAGLPGSSPSLDRRATRASATPVGAFIINSVSFTSGSLSQQYRLTLPFL